ncbi:unnamed protein product, partial [Amoebophrya sp. A25]
LFAQRHRFTSLLDSDAAATAFSNALVADSRTVSEDRNDRSHVVAPETTTSTATVDQRSIDQHEAGARTDGASGVGESSSSSSSAFPFAPATRDQEHNSPHNVSGVGAVASVPET